ncbi:MAG: VCBS repeat-containing protein [Planctomyces sp.]|nr:VCBS repeat-containing protein [Planctomyces sp.]
MTGTLFVRAAFFGGCLLAASAAVASEPAEVPLDHYYGFQPLELVKLSDRAHSIVPGDFNHDGRMDLAIVDNKSNHIALLIQRETPLDPVAELATRQVNELDEPWRFERRKLPMDREIQALCAGDFNGDGRIDLATFGAPDRLTIRYQPQSGPWTETREFRLPEVEARPWSIAAGDLNSDQRHDLVVLGKNSTYLLLQQADGTMADPVVLRNTSPGLGLAMIADVTGNGRNDLFALANDDQKQPICIRVQNEDGRLGPEQRFRLEPPRGVVLQNMDGKPGAEILAIDAQTNRLRMFTIEQATPMEHSAGRIVQYGFAAADGADREVDVGDIDGDGKPDVVATDPDRAQVIVFLQRNGQLDLGAAYPSFLGVSQIRLSDFDGNGAVEAAVLSTKENTLGVSQFENGRLTFPQAVNVAGEVRAFETIDLNGDGRDELAIVVKDSQATRSRTGARYLLSAVTRGEDGTWTAFPLGGQPSIELDLKSDPVRMVKLDANQDGRPDLLLTFEGGKNPKLLVQGEGAAFAAAAESGGVQLGEARAGSVHSGTLDKPVLLIAQGNFARSVKLDDQGRWQVLDQFNAGEVNSRVEGVATLDLDGEPGAEVVLVDSGVGKLRILRQGATGYAPWREIDLVSFPYRGIKVADLNSDGRPDLLLAGAGRFAVLYAGQPEFKLLELASFESKLRDTFMIDLVAGDLNGDGRPDAAVFDARTHIVELLAYSPEKGLQHAMQFKVFDSKSFQGGGESGFQPREGTIADVTGDGRADLLLLVHDRLLIYPQDAGETPAATEPGSVAAEQ